MHTSDPQPTPATNQHPPQLDVERLEADIEHRMATSHVPALALAIVTPQTTIYANGFGVISVDEPDMLTTPATLFRIASFTKPLVGTMIMRLQATGRLSIDQPVTELVPTLRFQNETYGNEITLRHLLSHTSGLQPAGVSGDNRAENALAHLVTTELPHWPFLAPPGTLHAYSNLGLCAAGYIAEVLTQIPFQQLMMDEMFTPLDMHQTTFDPFMAMTFRFAQAHNLSSDGHLVVQRPLVHNAAFTPAGGAFSTVLDLTHFVQLHLNRGAMHGQAFLPANLIDMMHQSQTGLYADGWLQGYGLTFFTGNYKGVPMVWHGGSIGPWWGGRMTIAPNHGVGVVLLVSRIANFRKDAEAITNSIFDQLLGLPPVTARSFAMDSEQLPTGTECGNYLNPYDERVRISFQSAQLTLEYQEDTFPLTLVRPDMYISPDYEHWVRFVAGPEHDYQYLLLDSVPYQRVE